MARRNDRYLNHIAGDAGSYTQYWRDIAPDVSTPAAKKHMLGGEVSMWTDDYCYEHQCGVGAYPPPSFFFGGLSKLPLFRD